MEDEVLKMAILYCIDKDCGYYDDLIYELGDEIVENFCHTGFIRTGYTRDRKTWSVTNLAKTFKRDLDF